MKLIDLSVQEFVRDLDSPKPAPGGGSVSAVAASMGIALSRMVGHLTIPKKKFKRLDESTQEKVIEAHESIKEKEKQLMDLVDEDTEAFNAIMSALKMPKDSEEEKKARSEAIEKATYKATTVPLEIAELAYDALGAIEPILKHGNKHAISDIGVGALMLYAGLEGAVLNVKINLGSLSDDAFKEKVSSKIETFLKEGKRLQEETLKAVHDKV